MTTSIRSTSYARVFLVIVAINIALYVLQVYKGVDWIAPQTTHMIEWGANVAPLTMTSEPWRLFSSMFLHIGFIHLALNMYMLLICGPSVERAFGSVKFSLIYLISGSFGSLASALWHAQNKVDTVSLFGGHAQSALQVVIAAGASGALMGIAGAFLARSLVLKVMDENHNSVTHGGMRGVFAQTIGINLVMGFFSSGVDNAGHVGGLLAGAAIGGGLALMGEDQQRVKRIGATFAIVVGSLALLFFAMTRQPSAELLELKIRISDELQELNKAKMAELARLEMTEEIQRDLKNAAAPVDEKTAAGTQMPLGKVSRVMLLSKDGKRMYLVGSEENFLDVVDLEAKKVIATVSGEALKPREGDCDVINCMDERGANAIALSPDEHFAYVSSMVDNAVTVIDLQQNRILTSIPVGAAPRSIKVSGNGQRAYVLNTRDNSVSVLDLASNKVVGIALTLQGGALRHSYFAPSELWLANDDKEVWVVNPAMNLLSVVDTGTMTIRKELKPGSGNSFRAGFFFPKSASAWIVGVDALDLINLTTKSEEKFISFCEKIRQPNIDINRENTIIALDSTYGNHIRLVKIKTQKTMGMYPVTGRIDGVRFSADGKQLYVLNNNSEGSALAIIDINKTIDVANYIEQSGELFCTRKWN